MKRRREERSSLLAPLLGEFRPAKSSFDIISVFWRYDPKLMLPGRCNLAASTAGSSVAQPLCLRENALWAAQAWNPPKMPQCRTKHLDQQFTDRRPKNRQSYFFSISLKPSFSRIGLENFIRAANRTPTIGHFSIVPSRSDFSFNSWHFATVFSSCQ